MILDITPEQLRDACDEVYGPGRYAHAPAQVFIEHAWSEVTYLRCSFPEAFTYACAGKLDALRKTLATRHGESHLVFCVYTQTLQLEQMLKRAAALSNR